MCNCKKNYTVFSTEADKHVSLLNKETIESQTKRYYAGRAKYKTNLWEYGIIKLLDNAIEENDDGNAYLRTLRQRLPEVIAICNEAIEDTDINGLAQDKFKEIKNILETGNKEGVNYNE